MSELANPPLNNHDRVSPAAGPRQGGRVSRVLLPVAERFVARALNLPLKRIEQAGRETSPRGWPPTCH